MFLHNDREAFREIVDAASQSLNIPVAIVEKDYYVTLFLKQMLAIQPNLVFKGGTSLSKCYHLIERFSEDIDLSIFLDNRPTEGQKKTLKQNVLHAADAISLVLSNPDSIRSRRDFNRYEFEFDSLYDSDYLKQHLVVETAVFIKVYPVEKKQASSFVHDFLQKNGYPDLIAAYNLHPFDIQTQSLERTLVDKVYAICDYTLSGTQSGHSRHIYDLYKLLTRVELSEELKQLALQVGTDRRDNKNCPSAQEGISVRQILTQIIADRSFQKDYETITSVLLFEQIPYETAVTALQIIADSGVFQ